MGADHVDHVRWEWEDAWPDLDTSGLAVVGRVSRLSRFFEREVVRVFTDFGLTGGEFDVLATLRRSVSAQGALTQTELSTACLLSSAAMTHRIDGLERAGFVTRVRDSVDRRVVLVQLTPEGRDLVERALVVHMANEIDMLSAFTAEEREALAGLLRKLLIPREMSGQLRRPFPGQGGAEVLEEKSESLPGPNLKTSADQRLGTAPATA